MTMLEAAQNYVAQQELLRRLRIAKKEGSLVDNPDGTLTYKTFESVLWTTLPGYQR